MLNSGKREYSDIHDMDLFIRLLDKAFNRRNIEKCSSISIKIKATRDVLLEHYTEMVIALQKMDTLNVDEFDEPYLKEVISAAHEDLESVKRLRNEAITYTNAWSDIEKHHVYLMSKSKPFNTLKIGTLLLDKGEDVLNTLRDILFDAVNIKTEIDFVLEKAKK